MNNFNKQWLQGAGDVRCHGWSSLHPGVAGAVAGVPAAVPGVTAAIPGIAGTVACVGRDFVPTVEEQRQAEQFIHVLPAAVVLGRRRRFGRRAALPGRLGRERSLPDRGRRQQRRRAVHGVRAFRGSGRYGNEVAFLTNSLLNRI